MKKNIYSIILLIVLLIVALVTGYILFKKASPSLSITHTTQIDRTAEEIMRIRQIKQWEFLSAGTEEMVDTSREGFLKTDVLCRIYTGTLRLGINMEQASPNWCTVKDSVVVLKLPPVTLLDERFIDEARTRSFYEKGQWDASAKEALYRKAETQMKRRVLNKENIAAAEENGRQTFLKLFQAFGYKQIEISFKK